MNIKYDIKVPDYKNYNPTMQDTATVIEAVTKFVDSDHLTMELEFEDSESASHGVSLVFQMIKDLPALVIHYVDNKVYLEKPKTPFNDVITNATPEDIIKAIFKNN